MGYSYLLNECDNDSISVEGLDRLLRSNKILSKVSFLSSLLLRAKNSGAFLRYPTEGILYDSPGSNSGILVRSSKSYLHETKHLIENLVAQLLPDILVDSFDSDLKDVYVFYRLVRKAMVSVFANYIFLRNLEQADVLNDESRYYISVSPFYRLLSYTWEADYSDIYGIMRKHVDFCVLGDKRAYSEIPHIRNLYESVTTELSDVYSMEYIKVLRNYGSLRTHGGRYLDWAAWASDEYSHFDSCYVKPYCLTDFKSMSLGLDHADLVSMLFDRLYIDLFQPVNGVLYTRSCRETIAKDKIRIYNGLENFISCDDLRISLWGGSLGYSYIVRHYVSDLQDIPKYKDVSEALEAYLNNSSRG